MQNVFQLRASDLVLDKVYNPLKSDFYGKLTPDQLDEWCGIIPDFFVTACITAEQENPDTLTLQHIADGMDRVYQFGGFGYPWGGTVSPKGIYQSQYDDDPPLPPLVQFSFCSGARAFDCFVYDHAIVAIRERGTSPVFIGRFD